MGVERISEGGSVGVLRFRRRRVYVFERVLGFWLGAMLREIESLIVLGAVIRSLEKEGCGL
jgi:hypothetical protein